MATLAEFIAFLERDDIKRLKEASRRLRERADAAIRFRSQEEAADLLSKAHVLDQEVKHQWEMTKESLGV
jgi:hypothetical protein